jgi:hypothetical protein
MGHQRGGGGVLSRESDREIEKVREEEEEEEDEEE